MSSCSARTRRHLLTPFERKDYETLHQKTTEENDLLVLQQYVPATSLKFRVCLEMDEQTSLAVICTRTSLHPVVPLASSGI